MAETAEYWDGQAATFDDAPDHGLGDRAVRTAWAALLLPLLPPTPALVADLGCGTGTLAVLLGEAGHPVRGIDFALRMVERARAKAEAAGVAAQFAVGDAMAPPWRAGCFDVVLARHVLWALPDVGMGLDRWLQLLKPNGRLVLVEGRWSTGGGLASEEALALLKARDRRVAQTPLDDPALWGGPIRDERYLLVSPPPAAQ